MGNLNKAVKQMMDSSSTKNSTKAEMFLKELKSSVRVLSSEDLRKTRNAAYDYLL